MLSLSDRITVKGDQCQEEKAQDSHKESAALQHSKGDWGEWVGGWVPETQLTVGSAERQIKAIIKQKHTKNQAKNT
jgi:hypothetical protein